MKNKIRDFVDFIIKDKIIFLFFVFLIFLNIINITFLLGLNNFRYSLIVDALNLSINKLDFLFSQPLSTILFICLPLNVIDSYPISMSDISDNPYWFIFLVSNIQWFILFYILYKTKNKYFILTIKTFIVLILIALAPTLLIIVMNKDLYNLSYATDTLL